MTEQEHHGRFKNLVQQIVFGKLIIFTGQYLPPCEAVLYRSGHVNFAANSSDRLLLVQILTVKALFQLSTATLCKNRSKQDMYVLELFSSNILIAALIQGCEGIRKHIVYVFYEDAFIFDH